MPANPDGKPVLTRFYAALFRHRGIAVIQNLLAQAGIARHRLSGTNGRNTNADIDACTGVLAGIRGGVLDAANVQVAADIRADPIAGNHRAIQRCITAAAQIHRTGRRNPRHLMIQAVAGFLAFLPTGGQFNGEAVLRTAQTEAHTRAKLATAAASAHTVLTLRRFQRQRPACRQINILPPDIYTRRANVLSGPHLHIPVGIQGTAFAANFILLLHTATAAAPGAHRYFYR